MPIAKEAAKLWQESEPGAEYEVVLGAGRCANADMPVAFNDVAAKFISR
ncbi:hypothetical protein [Cohnella yongneupensis]|uniref:Uncharacterized protein n=1 Tax=Cohnella yongneupensis TaxID=425006 RepID=A0ABW0QYK7_9BACL